MAYDEKLAERMREVFAGERGVEEKRMFGGLAFMHRGSMCCGIVGKDLMVRVGPEAFAQALERPHARPMDFTGKPSKGMVYVAPAGIRTQRELASWIERGLAFTRAQPKKAAPKKKATKRRQSRARR